MFNLSITGTFRILVKARAENFPGRRIYTILFSILHTVLSTPILQFPPSIIAGIFPFISARTSFARVGLGRFEVFALGAQIGSPVALMNFLAVLFTGILIATVDNPQVTTLLIFSFL